MPKVTCPECDNTFEAPAANEPVRQPGVDGPYLDDVRRQQEDAYREFKNEENTGLVEVGTSTDESAINSHTDAEGNKLEEVTDLPKTDLEQSAAQAAEAKSDEKSDDSAKDENKNKDADKKNESGATRTSKGSK